MNRNTFILGVVFILLASACAPQAAPTANPVDIQNTAAAAALTMVSETQAAMPTAVPPTNPPSPTSPATNTPPPLPTSGTPGLNTTTGIPTTSTTLSAGFTQQAPQSRPTSSSGGGSNQDLCNQPLTSWQGPTANFSISNLTKPEGTIVLSMYVVTEMGQCGYLVITGDSFSGPVGQYTAAAFITGKQNFKAFGGFRITEGNWSIVVKNDSIEARGGCFPNC